MKAQKKTMIERKLNAPAILFGCIGGFFGHFLGSLLFALDWPRLLVSALYMAVLGFCILFAVVLAETIFPIINSPTWRRLYAAVTWRYLFPAVLITMLPLGFLFQLIYQWEQNPKASRDVYMLIDRSGSMEWNDPDNERLKAVNRLAGYFDTQDRLELIVFDHESEVILPLISAGDKNYKKEIENILLQITPEGGTYFSGVLELVYQRIIENISLAAEERESIVILLSDGESELSDDELVPFMENNIKINTVGMLLENKTGETMLAKIARLTAGQFVYAETTDRLDFAFSQLYSSNEKFIFNKKTTAGVDIWQWLLYFFAGLLLGISLAFIFDNRYLVKPLVMGGMTGGFLAGLACCFAAGFWMPAVILGTVFTFFTPFTKKRGDNHAIYGNRRPG